VAKTIRIEPTETGASPQARAKAQALVGRVVSDRLRLEHLIACSDSGAIYRAEHVGMRLRVVVKIMHADAPPDDVARFEREAIAGAHVRHANVASASDSGKLDDGSLYLVIEHVAGATLREVLDKGKVPVARAVKIARQLAAALAAVHEQGIVHRQIEPRNVMLAGAQGDEVKLIDFGLASFDLARFKGDAAVPESKQARALTAVGLLVGAGPYSPPEAALGTTFLDARSDLYSLGVILYEMLAGRRPFGAEAPPELFAAQRAHEPRPLPADAEIPFALESVVGRLLQRDAAARFATATEVVEALDAALPPSPSRAPPPEGAEFAPRPASVAPHGDRTPLEELVASVVTAVTRLGRDARAWAATALQTAGPAAKKPMRLPAWVLVVLASGVPLAFTIAWLLFRSPSKEPVPDDHVVSTGRVETPLEPSPAPEITPAPQPAIVAPAGAPSAAASSTFEELDAGTWRDRLRDAAKERDWARGAKPIQALAATDPAAFHDPNVIGWVVSVAVALETNGGEAADAVFEALSHRAGTDGLDMLFEIVRGRGGTKGSKRAAELLKNPEIAVMEPPPLRAVFELHDAPCAKKPELYAQAVKDGDQRALTELRAMREAECDRRRRHEDPCCFDHEPLDKAIKELRARLAPPKQ
jgi:serine/threonine-protein kinase